MKNYTYQNNLIGKKQLQQLLGWSFTNYDSMQACSLADELKFLGFNYATQAGISISIEDLRVPFIKNYMIDAANKEITNSEKIYLKGKITEVERFQKIIDTWSLTSESLKEQIVDFFKKYDPLNSVYVMAFSGARGNLSQVRQLVGMRGLMSDPSGEILNLPIKKNFREGLTITDYLMSGYGARKGIVDTALKTANSGYLTRRLIDVAQDIIIREKDCLTEHSIRILPTRSNMNRVMGRILNKSIKNYTNDFTLATKNTHLTSKLIKEITQNCDSGIELFIRSPLTCRLYRAICQHCYGWDLSTENLVDMGEAVGILAGQSIGEPGTQLTMRTFHTGGIFTSEARDQINSPVSGVLRFSKFLETIMIRTNRGEEVLLTKNSGTLVLIPENKNDKLRQISIGQNTILFPKNNQYVQKNMVIGELINTNKQVKREIKPILAKNSGEIFVPRLKNQSNQLNNTLIWLLSGQLYSSPVNSFINFYPDCKINSHSYIFRTKIVSNRRGFILYLNNRKELYQRKVLFITERLKIYPINFYQLPKSIDNLNHVLQFKDNYYLINTKAIGSKTYLRRNRQDSFGKVLTNTYKTQTGGTIYYNLKNTYRFLLPWEKIYFYRNSVHDGRSFRGEKKQLEILHRTVIWKSEETHNVNCEENVLIAKEGDYISKNFELLPDCYSKISGLVKIEQKNNLVQRIIVKNGLLYKVEAFKEKEENKKIFYPGERIRSAITLTEPCICEHIQGSTGRYLLLCPLSIYEFPRKQCTQTSFHKQNLIQKKLEIEKSLKINYDSKQNFKTAKSVSIISEVLRLRLPQIFSDTKTIEILTRNKQNLTIFRFVENLQYSNYLLPTLKYKNVLSCLLVKKNQFVDQYTNTSYFESLTFNSLEVVKFKINQQDIKQILLLTNDDCITIQKNFINKKSPNSLIVNTNDANQIGKIIIKNQKCITIQKGRPYFFPNCRVDKWLIRDDLEYKLLPSDKIDFHTKTRRRINLNTKNVFKISNLNFLSPSFALALKKSLFYFRFKFSFSKLFLKNRGNLYSCLIPRFLTAFKLNSINCNNIGALLQFKYNTYKNKSSYPIERILLLQKNNAKSNKNSLNFNKGFALIKFLEFPLKRSTKSIGLYSISEDFFEYELNSVFCRNNEFVKDGTTLGLLNSEKEITGDIVQGLPRIEEILEARKKKQIMKRVPLNQKKQLLIQKTSVDPDFAFRKIGTSLKETERVNPHKLLKAYFNYYGLQKPFSCDQKKLVTFIRLVNNFEGCYKSFKKIQSFILNSVQGVYSSQGVNINDKHLEVIINQMTTKVVISNEGNSPLLKCEVIDLYHIQHINQILTENKKRCACYFPLVLGITKAALNNPSFISAASFQETTRVLTHAAIEGRIDWLRGLKENIIIGHLIPAGTGRRSYKNTFKRIKTNLF